MVDDCCVGFRLMLCNPGCIGDSGAGYSSCKSYLFIYSHSALYSLSLFILNLFYFINSAFKFLCRL